MGTVPPEPPTVERHCSYATPLPPDPPCLRSQASRGMLRASSRIPPPALSPCVPRSEARGEGDDPAYNHTWDGYRAAAQSYDWEW